MGQRKRRVVFFGSAPGVRQPKVGKGDRRAEASGGVSGRTGTGGKGGLEESFTRVELGAGGSLSRPGARLLPWGEAADQVKYSLILSRGTSSSPRDLM